MGIRAVLGGPTAAGKTALAVRWAAARKWEIIAADSRQIYRGFAVGTGAPTPAEMGGVKHHLVGSADPRAAFSPKRYREAVEELLRAQPGQNFLVVGGSGLYLKELLYPAAADRGETPEAIRREAAAAVESRGLAAVHAELTRRDPEGMRRVHVRDRYRLQKRLENWLITGRSYEEFRSGSRRDPRFADTPLLWLLPPRAWLHQRIAARIHSMAATGWLKEVRALLRVYDPEVTPAFNAVGYREMAAVAQGRADLESTLQAILVKTRQYARRQITFFKNQFPDAVAFDPEVLSADLEAAEWDFDRIQANPAGTHLIDKGVSGA